MFYYRCGYTVIVKMRKKTLIELIERSNSWIL